MVNTLKNDNNMKKKFLYIAMIACAITGFTSCDDGLEDELFDKAVSLTSNGLVDYYIEYNATGLDTLNLAVSLNGTSQNDQAVTATLAVDPDTLEAYNFYRYRYHTNLYYNIAEEGMFTYANGNTVTIQPGNEYAICPIVIDFNKFDLYKSYVLPLKIASSSPYPTAGYGYNKVLYRLNVSNFFSGLYSSNSATVGEISRNVVSDATKIAITSAQLNALNESTCYLYMGNVTDTDDERDEYTMTLTIDPNVYTITYDDAAEDTLTTYTNVTVGSKWADKEIIDYSNGKSYLEVRTHYDPVYKNLVTYTYTLYFCYRFNDLRTEGVTLQKQTEGTFVRTKVVDLITGKEQ